MRRGERPKKDFTMIRNAAAQDDRLSYKARGLILAMLSFPPDWKFRQNHLAKNSPDGVDSVRTGLRELESAGYLKRSRERNPDGTLGDTIYEIGDVPDAEVTYVGFSNVGESNATNKHQTKTPLSKESGRASKNRNSSGEAQEPLIAPPEPPPPDSAAPPSPDPWDEEPPEPELTPKELERKFIGIARRAYAEEKHESWTDMGSLPSYGANMIRAFAASYDHDLAAAEDAFRAGLAWCREKETWWRDGRIMDFHEIAGKKKIERYAAKAAHAQRERQRPRHPTGKRAECEVGEVVMTDYGWGEILTHDPIRQGYDMRFEGVEPGHPPDSPSVMHISYEEVRADPHTREVVKR